MKRQTKIEVMHIDFVKFDGMINFIYYVENETIKKVLLPLLEFEQWLEKNDYLTICDEYFDLWASEFTQTSKRITADDFFTEDHYQEYKTRLISHIS